MVSLLLLSIIFGKIFTCLPTVMNFTLWEKIPIERVEELAVYVHIYCPLIFTFMHNEAKVYWNNFLNVFEKTRWHLSAVIQTMLKCIMH